MERMDQGAWIPCRRTVQPVELHHVAGRVAAWAQEVECAGARLWRQHRALPCSQEPTPAIVDEPPPRTVVDDVPALCALVRTEIKRIGWRETSRRSGICHSALHRAFSLNRRDGGPSLGTLTTVVHALGLELAVQGRHP